MRRARLWGHLPFLMTSSLAWSILAHAWMAIVAFCRKLTVSWIALRLLMAWSEKHFASTFSILAAKVPVTVLGLVSAILLFSVNPALALNNFPGTTITGSSGSLTASNVGATGQAGEPTTYGGGSLNTMWYSWTAPGNGTLNVQTCGGSTNFDTTLLTFTGSAVNALTNASG